MSESPKTTTTVVESVNDTDRLVDAEDESFIKHAEMNDWQDEDDTATVLSNDERTADDDDDDGNDEEGHSDDDDDDSNNGVIDDEGWKEIDIPKTKINLLLDDIDGQLMMKLVDDIEILQDKIEEGREKCQEKDKRRMTHIVKIANLFIGASFWSHLIDFLNTNCADDVQPFSGLDAQNLVRLLCWLSFYNVSMETVLKILTSAKELCIKLLLWEEKIEPKTHLKAWT